MISRKKIWICLSLLFISSYIMAQDTSADGVMWLVNESSSVYVNGKTNVNNFSCGIDNYGHTDTILVKVTGKDLTLTGSLDIDIEKFNCHNTMMTNDLRRTLKIKQFPLLNIRFLWMSALPVLKIKPKIITGLVNITIAGISKSFMINYEISEDANKKLHLLGSQEIHFSDFKLAPPKRLGGMVRAKDKLSVVFNLNIVKR